MMRTAISSVLLALVLGAAHAQQLDCKPASPQAITGNSNPAGKWAAWHCNGHVQIVVCATGHCTDAVINAAWWVWDRGATLADGNAALTKYKAGSICDPSVRAVWWPDRYKLREQFAKESRAALKMAEAAGVSDIKPNRNQANVKVS